METYKALCLSLIWPFPLSTALHPPWPSFCSWSCCLFLLQAFVCVCPSAWAHPPELCVFSHLYTSAVTSSDPVASTPALTTQFKGPCPLPSLSCHSVVLHRTYKSSQNLQPLNAPGPLFTCIYVCLPLGMSAPPQPPSVLPVTVSLVGAEQSRFLGE